jgi:hypothetical protein
VNDRHQSQSHSRVPGYLGASERAALSGLSALPPGCGTDTGSGSGTGSGRPSTGHSTEATHTSVGGAGRIGGFGGVDEVGEPAGSGR